MPINKFNYALPETLVETFRRNVSTRVSGDVYYFKYIQRVAKIVSPTLSAASLSRNGAPGLFTGDWGKGTSVFFKTCLGSEESEQFSQSPVPNP